MACSLACGASAAAVGVGGWWRRHIPRGGGRERGSVRGAATRRSAHVISIEIAISALCVRVLIVRGVACAMAAPSTFNVLKALAGLSKDIH